MFALRAIITSGTEHCRFNLHKLFSKVDLVHLSRKANYSGAVVPEPIPWEAVYSRRPTLLANVIDSAEYSAFKSRLYSQLGESSSNRSSHTSAGPTASTSSSSSSAAPAAAATTTPVEKEGEEEEDSSTNKVTTLRVTAKEFVPLKESITTTTTIPVDIDLPTSAAAAGHATSPTAVSGPGSVSPTNSIVDRRSQVVPAVAAAAMTHKRTIRYRDADSNKVVQQPQSIVLQQPHSLAYQQRQLNRSRAVHLEGPPSFAPPLPPPPLNHHQLPMPVPPVSYSVAAEDHHHHPDHLHAMELKKQMLIAQQRKITEELQQCDQTLLALPRRPVSSMSRDDDPSTYQYRQQQQQQQTMMDYRYHPSIDDNGHHSVDNQLHADSRFDYHHPLMDNRMDNRQLPMDNRPLSMDNRQMSMDNRQLPMNNRQMSMDNRHFPRDNRQLPMDNRQQSLDNRQIPMDNHHFPMDNRQLPMDNRQLPMDNRQQSSDNRQLPVDNRQIPMDNRQLPMDNRQQSMNNRQIPMDNRIGHQRDDDYLSPLVGSVLGSSTSADMVSPRSTNNGSATTAEVSSSSARNSQRSHADATTQGQPIRNDKDRKIHPFVPKISIPLKSSELSDNDCDSDAFCGSGRVPFTDRSSLSAASPRIDITPRIFSASNNCGNGIVDMYGNGIVDTSNIFSGWQNHLSALSDNLSTADEESVSRYSFSTADVHQRAAAKKGIIDLDSPYQDDDFSNDSPLFRALNESLKRPSNNSSNYSNYINRQQYDELSLVNSLSGDATADYTLQHSPSNDSMVLSAQTRRSRVRTPPRLQDNDSKQQQQQQDEDLSSIFRGWSNFSTSQDLYPLEVSDGTEGGSMGAGYLLLQPQTTAGGPLSQRAVIGEKGNSVVGGLSEPASSTSNSHPTAAGAGVGSGNKGNSQKLPPGLILS